jgi:hypothetical protein
MRASSTLLASVLLVAGCGDGGSRSSGEPSGTFQSDCRVRFAMTTGELTSTLQGICNFDRARGHFVGVNTAVECTRLDERASIVGANQCKGEGGECLPGDRRELYITAQSTRPIAAPLDLLDCRFIGSAPPSADDFEILAVYATDEDLAPVEPPPTLAVTSIECEPLDTTTTTLPDADPCAAIECASNEACVESVCVATDRYLVEFQTDLSTFYGSIQIDAHYNCENGTFEGFGDAVACTALPVSNGFAAFHDHECVAPDTEARLAAGVISLLGWQGPGSYLACEYRSRSGEPPTADTFRIDVVDATNLDGLTLEHATVSVAAVRPLAP